MSSKLQQVIRLLMLVYRNGGEGEMLSNGLRKGGELLVLLWTKSSPAMYTVAAAGHWFGRKNIMTDFVETLDLLISHSFCPYPEELYKFSDSFGPLHFASSFQVDQDCQDMETKTERFLQRVSLVNSQITIIFKVKNKEDTEQVCSFKSSVFKPVTDKFIAKDPTTYALSPFCIGNHPSCCQMHLVLEKSLPLLLPSEVVEAGLCGEMSITCLAALGPCMDQFPNWPARLSHIHVLAYSPSGIPIMREEGHTQLSFLQSLADSLFWGKLDLDGVCCDDTHHTQGSQFYEMAFSTGDEHSPETEHACSQAMNQEMKSEVTAVDQVLTVFLLIQYRDPFHSELLEFMANEETLERQLDKVLCHNAETVRSALQSLLEKTLKGFQCRKKTRQKLQSAMSVISSSVSRIVSSSSSAEFRSACMKSMKVQNTTDLSISLHQTVQRVLSSRFVSRASCTSKKAVKAVVSEQNSNEKLEQDLPGKRAHSEMKESLVLPKKWCSENTDEDWESSESSSASLDTQMTPQSSSQHSPSQPVLDLTTLSPSTELKNQQVENAWLQELENLSKWD